MHLILAAIPFFLLLIAIEIFLDRKRGTGYYRFNDAIGSLNLGIFSRITGIAKAAIGISVYYWLYHNVALFNLPMDSYLVWAFAFIAYDLAYYWEHRLNHRIAIMWGSHVVHHSSEEYNLTTALRQTSTPSIFGWLIYLPLAFIGVSPEMAIACGSLNLIYQFWVHTRHVDKMPNWYEAIFVTPSHHRVHHALNRDYIDKNYAGVFILWDKLFGSFKAESDDIDIVYGVSGQLNSWNPIWANCQVYFNLMQDAWRTGSWRDKVKVFFMPPGWRPSDVNKTHPRKYATTKTMVKYETHTSRYTTIYLAAQFIVFVGLVFVLLLQSQHWDLNTNLLLCIIATFNLWVISAMQSNTGWVKFSELARLLINAMAVIYLIPAAMLSMALGIVASFTLFSALSFIRIYQTETDAPNKEAAPIESIGSN
ncbi:sterol desaturase family protein [Thalassotalea euphylliae]|uniref:sterol desaturase family protein n=1 Tax=Thalassotalea euphylliae TaxID=1655234 RepID=UPI003638466A